MILVTGGAGFIGSALVARLVAQRRAVRVLDDFSTGRRERIRGAQVVEGDVGDAELVRRAMDGVREVAHLAALASVPRAEADPALAARTNVAGTLTVLKQARRAGVRALVYASSCSVYGGHSEGALTEDAPLRPESVYAATKLAGERHALVFHRTGGPPAIALRFFNVYGPGQPADSPYSGVLARFARVAREGGRPEIHGDGGQTRDFVYVEDVVEALLEALRRAGTGAGGQVYNVGTGVETSVLGVWGQVAAAAGSLAQPVFAPLRPGDVRHARADIGRARAALGFQPGTRLAAGIASLLVD